MQVDRKSRVRFASDTTYVFVEYVGEQLASYGRAYSRSMAGRTIYFIAVNQERHRRWRAFVPERRLEQQTLVHEYGHLLGLPTPDHGYYPNGQEEGLHCVNPECPLSKLRARAVIYNILRIAFGGGEYLVDYCEQCRQAIARAHAYWQAQQRIRAMAHRQSE